MPLPKESAAAFKRNRQALSGIFVRHLSAFGSVVFDFGFDAE